MKLHHVRILLSAAIVMLFSGTVSRASTRARFAGETVLNDPSVRISAGIVHTCQVNEDGTVRCWGGNKFGQLGNGSKTDQPNPVPVLVSGLNNAVAIAAGFGHTCALLADGTVRCWGYNVYGQLGDGGATDRLAPVAVSGLSDAVAIAAGDGHTCALRSTGAARCWGGNSLRQLGDGSTTDRWTPVGVVNVGSAVAITAGSLHTCALLADGTAKCWGYNRHGELGNGGTLDPLAPVAVVDLSSAVAIDAEAKHTRALLTNGTAHCWGENAAGELGDGTTQERHAPAAVTGLSNAVAITGGLHYPGANHTCALLADGTARCWGSNENGQLGTGAIGGKLLAPGAVSGLSNAVAITAGASHTCALLASGATACWGLNNFGQLGVGALRSSLPVAVPGGGGSFTARDIAAGRNHTCAVRANGDVACWGSNDSGQIGPGGTTGVNQLSPVGVPGLSNVAAIAAGDAHTCALLAAGTVRCWGANGSGQLGNNSTTNSPVPVTVIGLDNVVAIAAGGTLGSSHSCALRSNGIVRCWGANGSGQLGDGTTTPRHTPVTVRTNIPILGGLVNLSFVVAIAVGEFHSCALLADGSARCWGDNSNGQLGDNSLTGHSIAVPVFGMGNAVSIAAGDFHTCVLLAVGVPFCWGDNSGGQLGDATQTRRITPKIVSLDNTVAIAGGFQHSCALVVNGGARCWGDNSSGQLGDSTTFPHWFPAPVQSVIGNLFVITQPLRRAVNITTGRRHSCALLTTGGVSCWGDNTFGQIGLGSTIPLVTSPAGVPSFTLNIDPTVTFEHNSRVTTVTVVATCDAGQRLFIDVNLTQGTASGRGSGTGECTGGLERYPVTVPAQGRDPFLPGPAQVSAEAVIRDGGSIVDIQQWTRLVNLVNAP